MAGIKITDLPAAPSAQLTDVFPVDQLPGPITYKESNQQLLTLFQSNGNALTEVNDTNVTMTLGGSPSIALLNATSMTLGWSGQLSVPRGGTGTSSFTAFSVICAGTTATGAFQNVVGLGSSGQQLTSNGPGLLPTWQASGAVTPAALTKVDDTNVTLTLGGTPATALLQATSITAGWAGTLAETRGGTAQSTYILGDTLYSSAANTLSKLPGNITTAKEYLSQTGTGAVSAAPAWATISGADITGAALTKTDDTNVTLTLGGTPTTALLRAASITAGWTGQLSLTRGGTAASLTASNGGIVYSSASALAILSGTATAGQIVRSGSNTAPTWSTATYPATAGTSGNVLTSDGTNWISSPAAASGITTVAVQTFTSNGTYTPTTNMKYCIVEVVGGGGAGGSVAGAVGNYAGGAGGGGGGYSKKLFNAATIGTSQTVTIGAGGTAGAAGPNPGNAGGTSSLGSLITATGGTGGGGTGATTTAQALTVGGTGGVGTNGDVNAAGVSGFSGIAFGTIFGLSGLGGSCLYGAGGTSLNNSNDGNAGLGFGGGGGGGSSANSGSTFIGGVGTPGIIIITEYI